MFQIEREQERERGKELIEIRREEEENKNNKNPRMREEHCRQQEIAARKRKFVMTRASVFAHCVRRSHYT